VEEIRRFYEKDGGLFREIHSYYPSHAQLPNGHWYPTLRRRCIADYRNGQQVQSHNEEHYLQIIPDMQLDPLWFTNPAERFKDKR
jgi:hypothetical protein